MKSLLNQKLKNYNTIRIGGKVHWMFFPINATEIVEAIKFSHQNKAPFFILAGGSNTVFGDVDMNSRQVVINLSEFDSMETLLIDTQNLVVEVDPGVVLQDIVDITLDNNSGGMVGINRVPGTIGGAVVGNAGAYGCETCKFVKQVEYIKLDEIIKQPNWVNIYTLDNAQCEFGYRDSVFKKNKNWLITKIYLELEIDADIKKAQQKYSEIALKRDAIYPKGFASPGSLFKNILFDTLPADVQKNIPSEWVMYGNKLPVGKLLENLNCQGLTIGKIQMRPTHANIMTNLGGATFANAVDMVQTLQTRVKQKFGIEIEPEVRFVDGDFAKFWQGIVGQKK